MASVNISSQMLRFLAVGAFTNISLYIVFLVLAWMGFDHKIAMTLVYICGVIIGFTLNRNWTFKHNGHISHGFVKYSLLYLFGYELNLLGLYSLVDIAEYPYQIIQFLISMLLAVMFYFLQKNWIFRENPAATAGG